MAKQLDGPVLLVGHSYSGAVISEAGELPNVAGLVHVAAFAPDAGESPGQISEKTPPAAVANLAPDSDGYLWIAQDKFHESVCQDLSDEEALVMAVTQKAPLASTFGNAVTDPAWKKKATWYQVSTDDRMIPPTMRAAWPSAWARERRSSSKQATPRSPPSPALSLT